MSKNNLENETTYYEELCLHFIPELVQIILDYTQVLGDQLYDRLRISQREVMEKQFHDDILLKRQAYPELYEKVQQWILDERRTFLAKVLSINDEIYYIACPLIHALKIIPPTDDNRQRFEQQWKAARFFFLEQCLQVFNPIYHRFPDDESHCSKRCQGGGSWCVRSNVVVVRICPPTNHFRYQLLSESFPNAIEGLLSNQYFNFHHVNPFESIDNLYRAFYIEKEKEQEQKKKEDEQKNTVQ